MIEIFCSNYFAAIFANFPYFAGAFCFGKFFISDPFCIVMLTCKNVNEFKGKTEILIQASGQKIYLSAFIIDTGTRLNTAGSVHVGGSVVEVYCHIERNGSVFRRGNTETYRPVKSEFVDITCFGYINSAVRLNSFLCNGLCRIIGLSPLNSAKSVGCCGIDLKLALNLRENEFCGCVSRIIMRRNFHIVARP